MAVTVTVTVAVAATAAAPGVPSIPPLTSVKDARRCRRHPGHLSASGAGRSATEWLMAVLTVSSSLLLGAHFLGSEGLGVARI